jgi:hypothetical protein
MEQIKEIGIMSRTYRIISLFLIKAALLGSAPAQGQAQKNASTTLKPETSAATQAPSTPGRIAKFTGTKTLGDSNITEDASGKIGINTTLPTSQLTVNGIIEMMGAEGGIKFKDGTIQTTAGLTTISRDATLKGDGTQASPLALTVPLMLSGSSSGSVLVVSNTQELADGITVNGGPTSASAGPIGTALRAQGGTSNIFRPGGSGVIATGGFSDHSSGGRGVIATGGDTNSGVGGDGVIAEGGQSQSFVGGRGLDVVGGTSGGSNGGLAVIAVGGSSLGGAGASSGDAIVAFAGRGPNGAANGLAGAFSGDVRIASFSGSPGNLSVAGTLSKGGGSFKIDHPLDPDNKYLSHSFVESPDMMNIYNGNITTDGRGLAVVELPDYFDSLNRDFRYQLTVVGQFAQAIVAEEVKENRFTIQTSAPGVKVSWQVTGIRQDAWANKNRIKVEEDKSEKERGHYLHPEALGKAEERGVEWANRPELMREIKQRRLEAEQQLRQPRK